MFHVKQSEPAKSEPAKSHECAACGGSGKAIGIVEKQYGDDWSDLRRVIIGSLTCPVCSGSGRISDVIPARDAIADAETLRSNIPLSGRVWISEVAHRKYEPVFVYLGQSRVCVQDAARAAFYAVPGLRGDK